MRKMKLVEFNLLSQNEKINLLYEEGIYIGKQKINGLYCLLFQLEGFYIEIIYKKYRQYIKRIYCFADTEYLDPYLERMDIALLV
jgi:hypothetical protein